jgi:hypothetical protein
VRIWAEQGSCPLKGGRAAVLLADGLVVGAIHGSFLVALAGGKDEKVARPDNFRT